MGGKLWWRTVIASALLLGTGTRSQAGRDIWTSSGPDGGEVVAVATSPSDPMTLYAAKRAGGMFRSTDGGASWRSADTGLAGITTRALLVSPTDPRTVYLATMEHGVYKTTDGGLTWAAAREGLADASVLCLATSPTQPTMLFAGTLSSGVFRSVDAGASWSAVNEGVPTASITTLAVSATDSQTVYLGTQLGVWKSLDAGATWTAASNGLTSLNIKGLAVSPGDPRRIYAAAYSGGVFRSADGGDHWTAVNNGLTATYANAVVAAAAPETLYVRASGNSVYRSDDEGQSWTLANGPAGGTLFAIDVSRATAMTVYAGTSRGVLVSHDGGGTWDAVNHGLTNTFVYALRASASAPQTIYAAAYTAGVFRSTDDGDHWEAVVNGLGFSPARTMHVAPTDPEAVYVGTLDGLVFKSTDRGGTWLPANRGLGATQVVALAGPATAPKTVYAGTGGGGVFRTTDGGANWDAVNTGLPSPYVNALTMWPTGTDTLFAGSGNGVARTTDRAATWQEASNGLPSLAVGALLAAPTTPPTLYAGSWGGVYRSTDAGASWVAANTGLSSLTVQALAVSPVDPQTLLAATWGGGVFRTVDGGDHWAAVDSGLTNPYVVSLLAPAHAPGTVWAGTGRGGVFALTTNVPPVANAGPDQTVTPNAPVQLNGRGSTDADGDSLDYHWHGAAVTWISDSTAAEPSFTAPSSPGRYPVTLTVSDGTAESRPDTVAVTVAAPPAGWAGALVVQSAAGPARTVRFGWYAGASAGIDSALGEAELPPPQSGDEFDVRWVAAAPLAGLIDDYRGWTTSLSGDVWTLAIQAGTGDLPVTVSWDTTGWPAGGTYHLLALPNNVGVTVDMRYQTRYQASLAGTATLYVHYQAAEPVDYTYHLAGRWNLVSLPAWLPDSTLGAVLPMARSLFGFGATYHEADRFAAGAGYWTRLDEAAEAPVSGWAYPETALRRVLPAHWSLIGPGHRPVDVSALRRACPQVTSVFGYTGGYHRAATLEPGHAYWVNLSSPATVDLNTVLAGVQRAMAGGAATEPVGSPTTATRLWLDGPGGRQDVLLGVTPDEVVELPPVPPEGVFDVRVDVGEGVSALQVPARDGVYTVRLQGDVKALHWDMADAGPWQAAIGSRWVDLVGTGQVAVTAGELLRLRRQALPAVTALCGAYPNPFNPSTVLTYELATAGRVSLRVYGVTGQMVRELVDSEQSAGRHQIRWDGRDGRGFAVGGGVYLAELRADAYRGVARLLLVK